MQKLQALAIAAIAALAAVPAAAQPYLSGNIGYLSPQEVDGSVDGVDVSLELDDGFLANAAAGYRFGFGLRLELEGGYGQTEIDEASVGGVTLGAGGGEINMWTGAVNAFYDVETGTIFRPYLGGGVGVAYREADSVTVGGATVSLGETANLLWQLEAGLGIALGDHFSIVPSYRYMNIDGEEEDGVEIDEQSFHVFRIGLRLGF
jgi:OmpA-OmpF porin, OOP family